MSRLVVVGAGMVAHNFVATVRAAATTSDWGITVIGEESHRPYDRVALSSVFGTRDRVDLSLPGQRDGANWVLGDRVSAVNRAEHQVKTAAGQCFDYDILVMATGSSPFVPPVHGADSRGCFTFRTLTDVATITAASRRASRAVVVGGGLLGLEAAGALQALRIEPTVVELASRLLPLQVDDGGGAALRRVVQARGVAVRTGVGAQRVETKRGRVCAVQLTDGSRLPAEIVIFAVGVRPNDELARECELPVGERGGIVVNAACRTLDPAIYAIGECASIGGRVYGLVGPGYQMAAIAARAICGEGGALVESGTGGSRLTRSTGETPAQPIPTFETATKLKLLGVDVGSFGDAFATTPDALEVVMSDPVAGRYRKLVLSDDARTLLGGILVGDAHDYAMLRAGVGSAVPSDVGAVAAGLAVGAANSAASSASGVSDAASVCSCHNVSAGDIRKAVAGGCHTVAEVKSCTAAATGCGSCLPLVRTLLDHELAASGFEVDSSLCEHFKCTRPELFAIITAAGLTRFTDVIERHGQGRGCDICKPVVASILATLGRGHVLDGENAALQDTNDHVLANLQRDGTYSVIPRIPGGEITPAKLAVIAAVAARFDLYTKITGGQRIALFGARIEQLPLIWRELVDAGFESGHAYGKSVRTVKSCVGSTWCRFGVQDSVGMAIALELRYRGLRSPHKIKFGVSGCARECAEARSKDIGVIATEKGWNIYVGGNGGFSPRLAQVLVTDVDDSELIRYIDRFTMFYVRMADRLQRTAAWLEAFDGGMDQLRRVIIDDSLGLGDELESAMAVHVAGYSDEWQAVLEDPAKLSRFASFANAPEAVDPDLSYQRTREQRIPARSRIVDVSIGLGPRRGGQGATGDRGAGPGGWDANESDAGAVSGSVHLGEDQNSVGIGDTGPGRGVLLGATGDRDPQDEPKLART